MKIGDTVRFLNSTGGGRVRRLDGQLAYVEDDDGFEIPVLQRECVVVAAAADSLMASSADTAPAAAVPAPKTISSTPSPEGVEETEGGDVINLILAFAASDLKRLSEPSTSFDAFLVNDSNYFMAYTFAGRAKEVDDWKLIAQGILEPNIQEFVAEITQEMLPELDHIAVHYVAFKIDKPFALKAPGNIEMRLDTLKFFKLHCYRPSDYFDEPVVEMRLVTDDRPGGKHPEVDPEILRRNMLEKQRADRRRPRPVGKVSKPKARPGEPIVTDLHITELIDSTRGLSNADMLNLQIDRFREVMDANLKDHGRKLIFIHGKGEGVLRAALLKELNHRYKGCDVQDASFREYGFGATQVTIP